MLVHLHYFTCSAPASSAVIISHEKLSQLQKTEDSQVSTPDEDESKISPSKTNIIPDKG